MDITPYVERLRHDLLAAAEGSGEDVRAAAERLGFAIDPAARLAMMEAIGQAAAEISTEMPAGGVDVRLDGRDLAFVVETPLPTPPTAPAPPAPPTPPSTPEPEDDGALARITLRLPESVKTRAEEAAGNAGQSLNTWLVGVIRTATRRLDESAINVDIDLSSLPFLGSGGRDDDPGRGRGRRMNGWL